MPSMQLPNYLRAHRKRLGLSQAEVAFLLGHHDGAMVCRNEHATCRPSLPTALAYEIILDVPTKQLFAGFHEIAAQAIADRARTLQRVIREPGNPHLMEKKCATLDRLCRSITDDSSSSL